MPAMMMMPLLLLMTIRAVILAVASVMTAASRLGRGRMRRFTALVRTADDN